MFSFAEMVHNAFMSARTSSEISNLSRSVKKGLPPGSLVHIGKKRKENTSAEVMDYTADTFEERKLTTIDESKAYGKSKTVSWINVIGLQDTDAIASIGKDFGLHSLLLEDIVNASQRPKMEEYDNCLYITVRLFYFHAKTATLESEQVSLVLGKGFVLSFQEDARDVFDPIRDAIRKGKAKLRTESADFLLYRLLDVLVDSYFEVLEELGDAIDVVEEELLVRTNPTHLNRIHRLRRDIITMRKYVWPLREVIAGLERSKTPLIAETTEVYLRDVYDHIVQVIDTVETYRDVLGTMVDQYLSVTSNRMNEIMKVLTVIATIFMPLTFVVGVYGMNFHYMPELTWPYGYPMIWGLCIAAGLGMMLYFKRKGWM